MCCLFGLMDCRGYFGAKKKTHILSGLASECEERGTDATGIAYCTNGHLSIYKRPVAAHKLRFRIPGDSRVIMGHTRMATQGNAGRNRNNHPFPGNPAGGKFALAHNGVLYNDRLLRQTNGLPKTKIETDSYIAVQLIEQQKALDFSSLKYMAEQVEGTFTFTVLDERENLYFVKGDNAEFCFRASHRPENLCWPIFWLRFSRKTRWLHWASMIWDSDLPLRNWMVSPCASVRICHQSH